MRKFQIARLAVIVSCLCVAGAAADDQLEWSYNGGSGPTFWAKLGTEFLACGGQQQSPIDLRSIEAVAADVPPIYLDLQQFKPDIINDGHKIEVTPRGNGGLATYDGVDYNLIEFHFHMESEHLVDGSSYPMEAHFMLESGAKELLGLAVFFIKSEPNRTVQTILDRAPDKLGRASSNQVIDPLLLIPIDTSFFRYKGSLTYPPCTENVTWHVYKEPLGVSEKQLEDFARLFSGNHRPLQQRNRRYILEGK